MTEIPQPSRAPERRERLFLLSLSVLSGLMLGCSFPPSPLYSMMYVAVVPILILMDRIDRHSRIMIWTYPGLLVFHLIALYWVGGFTHGRDPYLMVAGAALVLGHPLFFWIPLLMTHFVRARLGKRIAWAVFPFIWVGFEYVHALGEFSFPWLTLANSQSYDLARIQMAEYTGPSGISLILLSFNVLAFLLIRELSMHRTRRLPRVWGLSAALLILYAVPWVGGTIVLSASSPAETANVPVRVGVVQPDIDPWEKWGEGFESKWDSYERQFGLLLDETSAFDGTELDLVVWPETAVPFYLLHPSAHSYRKILQDTVDRSGTPIFTGLPAAVYFDAGDAPITARPTRQEGVLVEYYNAATLLLPDSDPGPVYKKIVLVPFAERIPHAEVLSFLKEPLQWGVGISGWGKGSDTTVFSLPLKRGGEARFSAMICYESVYPEFVRQFVLRGAGFLVIITNDSWYGATSGPYQHAAFASLRSVETRRWVVRSANGGISGLIDPFGRMTRETELFTRTRFTGSILTSERTTFYVRHGDLLGQGALVGTVLLIGIGLAGAWLNRRR